MNLFKITMATLTVAIFAFGFGGNTEQNSSSEDSQVVEQNVFWVDSISELTDEQYPDNPDICGETINRCRPFRPNIWICSIVIRFILFSYPSYLFCWASFGLCPPHSLP